MMKKNQNKINKIQNRIEKLEYGLLGTLLLILNCFGAKYLFGQFTDNLVNIGALVFVNLFVLWLFYDNKQY